MKMSCLSVSLFQDIMNGKVTIKEYATLCKDLGLDAFDLGLIQIKNHTPVYIKQVKADIAEVGLELAMVTTYPDFSNPDPVQREREFMYLSRDIALASQLGAKFIRITAGQNHPETDRDEGIQWVIENFRNIAPIADKWGIQLVYEDHAKPGAWDYIDFSNPPDIFLAIAEGVKGTSIGINFDTANILVAGEDRTLEVLDTVYEQVKTIHVAETATKGEMDPVLLGTGIVPFKEIFTYLKEKKFDGYLCLEEWGNNGFQGVKDAVAFTKKMWEEC